MDINRRRFAQETVNSGEIEILAPVMDCCAAENYMGDVFRTNELRHAIGDASSFQADHSRAQAFGEMQIGGKGIEILFFGAEFPVDMDHVKFRIHAACHAGAARN